MKITTRLHRLFAGFVWNPLPGGLQRLFSESSARFYATRWSVRMIAPFCERYRLTESELTHYAPSSGQKNYQSFQDFFTRRLTAPLDKSKAEFVWPCQGYICDYGMIKDFDLVKIKGEKHPVPFVFGSAENRIPDNYTFINIFLHNHNYHRFHAPVSGTIVNIEYIKGRLTFLRPWLYRPRDISLPAFKNERVIVEIVDEKKRSWFITFVGGMGVGKIHLHDTIKIGARIERTDEIGYFLLGSTCCLAIPEECEDLSYMQRVQVGEEIPVSDTN